MADSAPKPNRRLLRGGVFWLSVALAGLIAGSWIKSYWRVDSFCYELAADPTEARPNSRTDPRVPRFFCISDSQGRVALDITFDNLGSNHKHFAITDPWTYGGFWYGTIWGEADTVYFCGYSYLIPHWFPLLLCLIVAWWASRPWRKHKRDNRRGFEVVAGKPNP